MGGYSIYATFDGNLCYISILDGFELESVLLEYNRLAVNDDDLKHSLEAVCEQAKNYCVSITIEELLEKIATAYKEQLDYFRQYNEQLKRTGR